MNKAHIASVTLLPGYLARIVFGIIAVSLCYGASVSIAMGAVVYDDDTAAAFGDEEIISESTLADMRGGMNIGGVDVAIAADMLTIVDGITVLRSALRLTDAGLTLVNNDLAGITARGIPGATVVSGGSANALAGLSPAVQINGLTNAAGVIINDNKGATAALASIGNSRLSNIVINQADNRTINQQLNIQLTVGNFQQIESAARSAAAFGRLFNTTSLVR